MVLAVKHAGINKNDMVNGEGVSVSFWTQGCPHHCVGCHNPETWPWGGGIEKDIDEITEEIIQAISANGIMRNFSILGGEPLCTPNIAAVDHIAKKVKEKYPDIKIYIWTGYTKEELEELYKIDLINLIEWADVVIEGRYDYLQRDISLPLRGSRNQRVLCKNIDF